VDSRKVWPDSQPEFGHYNKSRKLAHLLAFWNQSAQNQLGKAAKLRFLFAAKLRLNPQKIEPFFGILLNSTLENDRYAWLRLSMTPPNNSKE
jgi:hypothetical protein